MRYKVHGLSVGVVVQLFSDYSEHFFQRPDLLSALCGSERANHLWQKRSAAWQQLRRDVWADAMRGFADLGEIPGGGFSVEDGIVSCGDESKFGAERRAELKRLIYDLLPWRKGPWKICGEFIDSEWRSNLKFDSMADLYSEFRDKNILDIGSGNGYYAGRLSELGAASVLCLDPSERFLLQFELFQRFAKQPNLQLELLGFEDAVTLGAVFDVVLCMGVLYHQRNPLSVIEACRSALRPGGALVLESMTYPGDESMAFFPPDRYAKARNVYFLPTAAAMVNMCRRMGFKSVDIVNERRIQVDEQRRTELAPYESLSDFLDPLDASKTVEGWPAPQRALVFARL